MPWRVLTGYRPSQSRQVASTSSTTALYHPQRNFTNVQKTMDPTIARLINANSHYVAECFPTNACWPLTVESLAESVVTASKPGDIFVHRNIANQFRLDDDNAVSALTYAIDQLGVEHGAFFLPLVVVGHTQCGGATTCYNAALEAAASQEGHTGLPSPESQVQTISSLPLTVTPAPDTPLGRWLAPLTAMATELGAGTAEHEHDHRSALTMLVQANIEKQVENLCLADSVRNVWEGRVADRKVWVHGLLYEVESGMLRDLGVTRGPPHEKTVEGV
ncbi:carbonic anhydrase [Amylostereum chailletii]|nr:carbonic anhydrase [Amylostereum chailletii]